MERTLASFVPQPWVLRPLHKQATGSGFTGSGAELYAQTWASPSCRMCDPRPPLVHQGVTHTGFWALWWIRGREPGLRFFPEPSGRVRWVTTSYSSGQVSLLVTCWLKGILPLASSAKLGLDLSFTLRGVGDPREGLET